MIVCPGCNATDRSPTSPSIGYWSEAPGKHGDKTLWCPACCPVCSESKDSTTHRLTCGELLESEPEPKPFGLTPRPRAIELKSALVLHHDAVKLLRGAVFPRTPLFPHADDDPLGEPQHFIVQNFVQNGDGTWEVHLHPVECPKEPTA